MDTKPTQDRTDARFEKIRERMEAKAKVYLRSTGQQINQDTIDGEVYDRLSKLNAAIARYLHRLEKLVSERAQRRRDETEYLTSEQRQPENPSTAQHMPLQANIGADLESQQQRL